MGLGEWLVRRRGGLIADQGEAVIARTRLARLDDLRQLAAIERSAASVFRDVGLAWIAEGETVDSRHLAEMCENRTLWVAVDGACTPVGFLAARPMDRQFYVVEMSVARTHQRQGLGAALIAAAVEYAETAHSQLVTLTSYRDLPWNAPFYAKQGFVEIDAAMVGPQHVRAFRAEVEAGHDPSRRCVMAKHLTAVLLSR